MTYIDLRAIRELERLAAALRTRGGILVIAAPSAIVRRVFEILELDGHLTVAPSRQEAIAHIRAHAGHSDQF